MNMRIKAAVAAVLVTVVSVFSFPPAGNGTVAATSVGENENKLGQLQEQISEYDKKLESMNTEMTSLLERKAQIDEEIEIISAKMVKTNELIALYNEQISELDESIALMDADIEDRYQRFKSWLRMMQLFGDTKPLEMAFSADSFVGFLENVDRLGTMINYQNDVMDELRDDVKTLSEDKAKLDALRLEQVETMVALEADGQRLAQLREESENYITTLQKDMSQYEQLRQEVKEQEELLNAEIERQLREIARIEEEEARRQESIAESERQAEESRRQQEEETQKVPDETEAETDRGDTETPVDETKPPEDEKPSDGDSGLPSFMWPIAEKRLVSTTYLYQRPGDVPHRGIDIPAPAGTAIRAAESGTVITAAKHSSYGNYCIISHGNGYATLYAHCTQLYVTVGQKVSRGDTIASVGNTGFSGGNHLHLEVRKNGVLTDPLDFFAYMKDEIIIDIYMPS